MTSVPIAKRVQRVRLPNSEIARVSKFHENTVGRAMTDDAKVHPSTLQAIDAVVTAEELALRDYLLDLHPLPASEQA